VKTCLSIIALCKSDTLPPFLRSHLTFFRLSFLHQFFLMVTLKLNPLSSQNYTCKRSGGVSTFKYSAIFILNAVLFSGFLLDSRLYLASEVNILFLFNILRTCPPLNFIPVDSSKYVANLCAVHLTKSHPNS